jgi:predicted ATPase
MEYPYNRQNARGRITGGHPGAAKFTRTITNRDKEIKAVVYHPYREEGPDNRFLRAEEVYPTPPPRVRRR